MELRLPIKGVIAIATAHGMIRLRREDKHNFVIEVPDDLKAHRTDDRAIGGSEFIRRGAAGQILPKFDLLVPKMDEHGELAGLEPQQALSVGGAGAMIEIAAVSGGA